MKQKINCDVFLLDGTVFVGDICITGNLYAGDDSIVQGNISAEENVFTGCNVDLYSVESGGDTHLGNNSDACDIRTGGDAVIGSRSTTGTINSVGNVTLGNQARTGYINSRGTVILKEYTHAAGTNALEKTVRQA